MKKDISLSVSFALLITFSFPPFKFGFLAYVALIPLFYLLATKSRKEAFRWGYFAGLLTNLMLVYWIGWSTIAGAIGAILILPACVGFFGYLHTISREKTGLIAVLFTPFWWTAIEWLKTLSQFAFPWFTLGYSQSYYIHLIQYAEYFSVYGVSFWVVLLNALIFLLIKKYNFPKIRYAIVTVLGILFLLPYLNGRLTVSDEYPENTQFLRIGLVQGSIDPFKKWLPEFKDKSFETYGRLTAEIAREKPQLIIWPETATPCWLKHDFRYFKKVRKQVDSLSIPILTGTPDYKMVNQTEFRTYNSAILLRPFDPTIQTYVKMHLVPVGERIPYEDSFPFTLINELLNKLEMGQGNFSPGEEEVIFSFVPRDSNSTSSSESRAFMKMMQTLTTDSLLRVLEDEKQQQADDSVRFAVAICYESVFPQIVRNFVNKGAQFEVVITNDAWFGRTSMPYQHLQISIFRAIENRVSIARCANAGISAFIDPYGRVIGQTPLFQEASLIGEIPLLKEKTFYAKHGNLFSNAILIICGILILFLFIKRNKSATQENIAIEPEKIESEKMVIN